jgi:hypothetical protein
MFNVFRCSGYDMVIAEKAYNYDLQAYVKSKIGKIRLDIIV